MNFVYTVPLNKSQLELKKKLFGEVETKTPAPEASQWVAVSVTSLPGKWGKSGLGPRVIELDSSFRNSHIKIRFLTLQKKSNICIFVDYKYMMQLSLVDTASCFPAAKILELPLAAQLLRHAVV